MLNGHGISCVPAATDLTRVQRSLMPWGLRSLRKQILALEPDVVLYQLIQTALAVRLAMVGTTCKTVHQVPGPLYLENGRIRLIERQLAHLDDLIVCGSDYTERRYRESGVGSRRLVSIPFGVDTKRVDPDGVDRLAARRAWGIPDGALSVVMVAYAYPPKRTVYRGQGIKGHEVLLDAWSEFSRRYDDVFLTVVGDGWGPRGAQYRESLEDRLSSACRGGSVQWVTGQRDSRPFYALADVSVSPSLSDNHGAALEAGAMAVPSIVSSAGALPETVDAASGWVFRSGEPGDLVRKLDAARLASRDGSLRQMGAAARRRVQAEFDSYGCAIRVLDAIESVAAR
jgi:glycosyltransferase involved in cell wall biosynthesis